MIEAIEVLHDRVSELAAESTDKQLDNDLWILGEESQLNDALRSELLDMIEKLQRIEMQKQHIDC